MNAALFAVNYFTNDLLTNLSINVSGVVCWHALVAVLNMAMPEMNFFVRALINFLLTKVLASMLEGLGVMTILRREANKRRAMVSTWWSNFWMGPSMDLKWIQTHPLFLPAAIVAFVLIMMALETFAAKKWAMVASYGLELFVGPHVNPMFHTLTCTLDTPVADKQTEQELRSALTSAVTKVAVEPECPLVEEFVEIPEPVETQTIAFRLIENYVSNPSSDLSEDEFEEI